MKLIRNTAFSVFLLLLLAALPALPAPVPALAQAPRVSAVFPPGVRRGSATAVTFSGENLKRESQILVSGEGVTAVVTDATAGSKEKPASLVIQLQANADAAPGVRELRVLGPNGASNAARIAIGTLPETVETEPNDQPEQAQLLKELPVTVNGRIDPLGDMDTYRFRAAAGETWVFELGSISHGSGLDGYLTLRDGASTHASRGSRRSGGPGRELATAMATLNQDPRLIHTFEATGDYTLSIRDLSYRGGPESTYRLSIGQLPTVTRVLPLALPRGRTTAVQLAGVNLGGMETMSVSVPENYPGDHMVVVPKTPAGEAPPMSLTVSSLPQWVEQEPNDDPAHATRLPSLPGAVSGVIGHPGDVDVYAFHAAAGQKLIFELFGRRLGSRLDSFLRVLDPTGKELASNDDAAGKDSRLEWSPPAAGDYFVQVTDIAGEGGDSYGYRLEITTAVAPDFKLTVTPDVTNIGQGDSEVLMVRAERLNGFTGDIALRVEGLPQGVTASPGSILKGQDTVQITLTASPDARLQGFLLKVVGTGSVAGKPVEHAAEPIESVQLPGREDRRQRPTLFHVAGIGEPSPYTVAAEPRHVTLAPGATATITVKVARRPDRPDAKGKIDLDVLNVPEGVKVKAPAIPEDKSEGTVELTAPEKPDARTVNLIIRGRNEERTRPAPAITLVVTSKPAEPAKH